MGAKKKDGTRPPFDCSNLNVRWLLHELSTDKQPDSANETDHRNARRFWNNTYSKVIHGIQIGINDDTVKVREVSAKHECFEVGQRANSINVAIGDEGSSDDTAVAFVTDEWYCARGGESCAVFGKVNKMKSERCP